MWDQLEPPWQACLEETWAAYCAGSVPIGAVITGASGEILSRGRNRIREKSAAAGLISASPLAHAEMNALLALDFETADRHNCHLYTVTEPCPMCLGAIYMAGIYNLHYASHDPLAGSANLLGKTPYLAQKPVKVFEPDDPELEALVVSLFVEFAIMDAPLADASMARLANAFPEAVDLGRSMAATGVLRRLRSNRGSAREMAETITSHLSIGMQAYGAAFARIYNLRWGDFAQRVAPALREYYELTPQGRAARKGMPLLLDLCCGAGHLAGHFLEHGYQVTGMDLSPAMLDQARQNNAAHIVAGQARFLEGDAAAYTLDQPVDFVLSTFDALNHLPDLDALCGCFASTCRVLKPNGIFIFDLNTRLGLRRWATINLQETPELTLITSGLYDEPRGKAHTRVSGYIRADDGRYDRFEETVYNTAFDLSTVKPALLAAGFQKAHFARLSDLSAPLADPEAESRVFIVTVK